KGGCLHVDGDRRQSAQPFLELLVMLPETSVRRVDDPRPVLQAPVDDLLRDELVELERGERRHLRREVVVRGALAPDGGDRKDEMTDLGGGLQPAALAEE